jgi:hypothetical protein
MKILLLLLILQASIGTSLVAETSPASPLSIGIERRVLTWADFNGTPEPGSPYDATTLWWVFYDYRWARTTQGLAVTVSVRNELRPQSWVKRPLPSNEKTLLSHEQLHYDFSVLVALEFKRRVAAATFTDSSRVEGEIKAIFDAVLEGYKKIELLYDEETKHGGDLVIQARWEARIAKELAGLWKYR